VGRTDSIARLEYEVLVAVLQAPDAVPPAFDSLDGEVFQIPEYRAVHDAIRAAGGVAAVGGYGATGGMVVGDGAAGGAGARWLLRVREAAPSVVAGLVTQMAVEPLPVTEVPASAAVPGEEVDRRRDYVRGVVARLMEAALVRQIAEVRGRLGRLAALGAQDEQQSLLARLQTLDAERRALREEL
jgi:DNA primase